MDAIDVLLSRGVDTIYPGRDELEKVLRSGKKLTLYQGFDRQAPNYILAMLSDFRKLRQWQDLGHKVIFLIGDGTGLAGDPSGKMKARGRFMSRNELRDNAKAYLMQASKIVRFDGENPIEIRYNGDWLTKLTLEDLLGIAQHFTVQQMIERDMYQVRIKAGDPINLREFLYPLLQGYDSVAMKVDLELGGTDQTFNMLAGRTLVKSMLGTEKFVMTVPILADSKGVKIGKTEGNVIGLTDAPNEFYAKIMSLGDDAIIPCFQLLTDVNDATIGDYKQKMVDGENPMLFKKLLAHTLTEQWNSRDAADTAQSTFERMFRDKAISTDDVPTFETKQSIWDPAELLLTSQLVTSKSEAKRLLKDGAVEFMGSAVNPSGNLVISQTGVLKVGKKRFITIVLL